MLAICPLQYELSEKDVQVSDFVLKSKYVFVDTNIYEGKNFQFLTYELERLSLLASAGEIILLMSPIIDFEIRGHIKAGAAKAAKSVKDFKKEAMVLRNATELPVSGVFERVSALDISDALLENYSRFVELATPEIVPFDDVDPVEVFERYFSGRPPFSESKKHEFPDGFALLSLVNYSRAKDSSIYVVSNDRDMEGFCLEYPSLIHLDNLDPIINALSNVGPFNLSVFAGQMLDKLQNEILDAARHYLGLLEFDTVPTIDEVVTQQFYFKNLSVVDSDLDKVELGYAEFNVVIGLEIWADQVIEVQESLGQDSGSEQCSEGERIRQLSKFNAIVDMPVMLNSKGYNLETAYLRDVDPLLRSDLSLRDAFFIETFELEQIL